MLHGDSGDTYLAYDGKGDYACFGDTDAYRARLLAQLPLEDAYLEDVLGADAIVRCPLLEHGEGFLGEETADLVGVRDLGGDRSLVNLPHLSCTTACQGKGDGGHQVRQATPPQARACASFHQFTSGAWRIQSFPAPPSGTSLPLERQRSSGNL